MDLFSKWRNINDIVDFTNIVQFIWIDINVLTKQIGLTLYTNSIHCIADNLKLHLTYFHVFTDFCQKVVLVSKYGLQQPQTTILSFFDKILAIILYSGKFRHSVCNLSRLDGSALIQSNTLHGYWFLAGSGTTSHPFQSFPDALVQYASLYWCFCISTACTYHFFWC